jgi:hypothetical protein
MMFERCFALALAFLGLLGCGGRDACVEGIEEGRTYRVTVVEPYVREGTFLFDPGIAQEGAASCGMGLDFLAGNTFEIRAGRRRLNAVCWMNEGEPKGVPNVTLGRLQRPAAAPPGSTALVTAFYEATVGDGCFGREWNLRFSVHGDSPFAVSVPGAKPVAVMLREFIPAMGTSPACQRPGATTSDTDASRFTCRDAFVVKLEPVP